MHHIRLCSVLIRLRPAMLGAAVLGSLFSMAGLQAQPYAQYGSGVSTLHADFDPLQPSPPIRLPQIGQQPSIVIPRPSVLPPAEYQRIKSAVPPRIPNGTLPSILYSSLPSVPVRTPLATNPSLSFEGAQETVYTPPSTNIAAGPEDVIQILNSSIARYTKAGQQTNITLLQQWFSDFSTVICASNTATCVYGDVSIRYDQMQGRFLLTMQVLDITAQTSYLLISASNGATYAGGWRNWALNQKYDGTSLSSNWGDFPQIGFDDKAVYVTVNMFSFSAFTFQYAKVRIIKKTDLYNPAIGSLPYKDIFNLKNEDGTTASTLQAPHLRGRSQVNTQAGVMINASDVSGADYLTLWRINDPTGTPTVTRTTVKGIWPYRYPAAAPQLNSAIGLDTGPSSIAKVIQREGRLYVARNAGYLEEPVTVTYDLIDLASSKVVVQSRFTNGNFFYPAFDVPATLGPGNDFPNQLIAGTTTKSTGGLTFAGLTKVKDGEDVYDRVGTATARWGDYNGAAIDPIQGGLWISGEYAKAKNQGVAHYGTWNSYFPWGTSQVFDDVSASSLNFDHVNLMNLWSVTRGCSIIPKLYCPSLAATREAVAIFIIRSLYGEDFTYSQVPYFTDVPANSDGFRYIQKFKELGFTNGCSATTFCPSQSTTRQQAATFIVRAKMKGILGESFTFPATPYFTDVPASDPNFSYIQKFRELGLTNGCSATTFCPSGPLLREQLATFIIRAFFN